MSLRAVRSPLAPKMMIEQGSTTLRPVIQPTDHQLIKLLGLVHVPTIAERPRIFKYSSCLHWCRRSILPGTGQPMWRNWQTR